MPSPVEGSSFYKGEKRVLTFITGVDMTSLPTRSGKFVNLTSNNNVSYNNSDITVADAVTGTLTVSANLSEAGEWMGQFYANNSTTLLQYSPVYTFKVLNPIA
jgi:hypothetical protein